MTRWMQFVDGENLTIRAQELLKDEFDLADGPLFKRDVFLWPAKPHSLFEAFEPPLSVVGPPLRSYYYTSVKGDQPCIETVEDQLRALRHDPAVFKKDRPDSKAKGVDIALTKDMLAHAFRGNFDAALLVAGDGDYFPLVDEVKRLGKSVEVRFIERVTARRLKLSADRFIDVTRSLREWAGRVGKAKQTSR